MAAPSHPQPEGRHSCRGLLLYFAASVSSSSGRAAAQAASSAGATTLCLGLQSAGAPADTPSFDAVNEARHIPYGEHIDTLAIFGHSVFDSSAGAQPPVTYVGAEFLAFSGPEAAANKSSFLAAQGLGSLTAYSSTSPAPARAPAALQQQQQHPAVQAAASAPPAPRKGFVDYLSEQFPRPEGVEGWDPLWFGKGFAEKAAANVEVIGATLSELHRSVMAEFAPHPKH